MRFAGLNFSPSSRPTTPGGYSGASNIAQLGGIFNELENKSPDYAEMAANAIAAKGALDRANMDINSRLHQTGLTGEYNVEAAKIAGEAAKDAASKQKDGAVKGGIFSAIGAIGGALLSDESTKTNIEPIENALEILRGLKPVSFHYNEDYSCTPERLHYGFIAQDYAKVMPDATYYDESIDKLAIDRTELIGLLVRAVQQLEGRITRMEAKQVLEEIK